MMDFDWNTLDELRASYLSGGAGAEDYWTSEALLRGYDATFARRIAWKWAWVFDELDRRGWSPPAGSVFDYGCGTGVALREVLARYRGFSQASLHDRSPRALRFAVEAVRREFPDVRVDPRPPGECGLLLVSHVLTELDEAGVTALVEAAQQAQAVILVEPGTREASRKLIAVRERLLADFYPVAPCVHRAACGLLQPGNDRHWCHFFAKPPGFVFTDSDWVHFGRIMGIDLRSLPLSFLVLDRRVPAPLPEGTVRVLGNPRMYKAHALLHGCDASGVAEKRLTKRCDPAWFKATDKRRTPTLQNWRTEGSEIISVSSADSPPSGESGEGDPKRQPEGTQ